MSGKIRIYIIDCGRVSNDRNLSQSGWTLATLSNPNPVAQWYTGPSWAALIQHPQAGNILFDLGCHSDSATLWPECIRETCHYVPVPGSTMEEGLAIIGLKPEDIDHVIMSHMHMDHIGNISLFKDTAEFWVSRKEAEFAFTTVCASPSPEEWGFYNKSDVLCEVKNLHYVEEDSVLFSGIEAIMIPGHTPGMMGVVVHLESGAVLIASDGLNSHMNFEGGMPGVCLDTAAYRASVKKMRSLQKRYNAQVWYGHDIDQFAAMKKPPAYYE